MDKKYTLVSGAELTVFVTAGQLTSKITVKALLNVGTVPGEELHVHGQNGGSIFDNMEMGEWRKSTQNGWDNCHQTISCKSAKKAKKTIVSLMVDADSRILAAIAKRDAKLADLKKVLP